MSEHGQLRVNVNGHEAPRTAGPELTTFAERMEDEQTETEAPTPGPPPDVVLSPATPTSSPGATLVRKFGSLLIGGGGSVRAPGDRANKRTSILAGFGSPRPSTDMDNGVSEKERDKERKHAGSPLSEKAEQPPLPTAPATPTAATSPTAGDSTALAATAPAPATPEEGRVEMHVTPTGGISHSQAQPLHRRAATILDPQGHAKRHERRSSTGGALLSSVTGTIGRHRRPSTSHGSSSVGRPSQGERPFTQTAEVPEEDASGRPSRQGCVNGTGTGQHELTDGEDEANASAADKDFKPVFLKGLFRYVLVLFPGGLDLLMCVC